MTDSIEVAVLKARIRELMDHNPIKAEALKSVIADHEVMSAKFREVLLARVKNLVVAAGEARTLLESLRATKTLPAAACSAAGATAKRLRDAAEELLSC